MKKIILISLISLALFGCEEKKVTKEMLIGDWECNETAQIALWKDGVFQDYEEVKESKIKQAFFVENGVFMVKESNQQSSTVFNLKSYYDNKVYVKSVEDYQFKITRNIEYITKDALNC